MPGWAQQCFMLAARDVKTASQERFWNVHVSVQCACGYAK